MKVKILAMEGRTYAFPTDLTVEEFRKMYNFDQPVWYINWGNIKIDIASSKIIAVEFEPDDHSRSWTRPATS